MDCSRNKVIMDILQTFSQLLYQKQASFKEESYIFLTSFYKTCGGL